MELIANNAQITMTRLIRLQVTRRQVIRRKLKLGIEAPVCLTAVSGVSVGTYLGGFALTLADAEQFIHRGFFGLAFHGHAA